MNYQKINNKQSNTFLMGFGDDNLYHNALMSNLLNIEKEINQQIANKPPEDLSTPKNTFNTIINKLEQQVTNLNNQIKNFNKEKAEIIEMSRKEITELKGLIKKIYTIFKILTKSMDLNASQKKYLLEKLKQTIESSPGFLNSLNQITTNKQPQNNSNMYVPITTNQNNTSMSNLLHGMNIDEIANKVGETQQQMSNNSFTTKSLTQQNSINFYNSLKQNSQPQKNNNQQQQNNNQQQQNNNQQQQNNNQQQQNNNQQQQNNNQQQSTNNNQQQSTNNNQQQSINNNQQKNNQQQSINNNQQKQNNNQKQSTNNNQQQSRNLIHNYTNISYNNKPKSNENENESTLNTENYQLYNRNKIPQKTSSNSIKQKIINKKISVNNAKNKLNPYLQ